ncbi:hypothetical protein MOQ72_34155 [Saccharopolyspora sp. K220]|uniref:hypothetical protein n=1 Tax=Saccharopolyspora soli TaxID=2926618 RepID=UPI001F56C43A|nr:hypothetical protein [Saccharopolyspora soli]MCI2422483.1 hypothetical protein [Saccharopolyspora soli]
MYRRFIALINQVRAHRRARRARKLSTIVPVEIFHPGDTDHPVFHDELLASPDLSDIDILNDLIVELEHGTTPRGRDFRNQSLRPLAPGDVVTLNAVTYLLTRVGWICLDNH